MECGTAGRDFHTADGHAFTHVGMFNAILVQDFFLGRDIFLTSTWL